MKVPVNETGTMIKSSCGYDIPVRMCVSGTEKKVLVMAHGFGSSKQSPTVSMMMEELPSKGIAVIAFDFPAHGESPVDGTHLRLENCIEDLRQAVAFARETLPDAEIINFGSSFGAYITLQYINAMSGCDRRGIRAFLRSAAVNMPELFASPSDEERRMLERDGYIMLNYEPRDLKITAGFIADLQANDLFADFQRGEEQLRMIHGTDDREIDYAKAVRFAAKNSIDIITVEGGDHQLSVRGAPETVVKETLNFIMK